MDVIEKALRLGVLVALAGVTLGIILTLAGVPDPLVGVKALVHDLQDFLFS